MGILTHSFAERNPPRRWSWVGDFRTLSWTHMIAAPLALSLLLAAAPEDAAPEAVAPVAVAPNAPAPAPASPGAEAPKRFTRIAVYDFATDGIEPRVGRFVTDAMVDELRKLDGVSVVAMDEVRAMIAHESMKQVAGCTDGDSCLSELGDALGVDELVVGSLAVVGGVSVAAIRRIDQNEAKPIASLSRRLVPAAGEEFLAEIGPAVANLYKDKTLRVGATRGVPPEVGRRLNPPPLKPWIPLATATGALVVTVAGAAAGVAALSEEGAHAALVRESLTAPQSGSLVVATAQRARDFALAANVLYGAAAVVGLAAAAMLPFTDFNPPVEEGM